MRFCSPFLQSLAEETRFQLKLGPFAQLGQIARSVRDILPNIKSLGKHDSSGVLMQAANVLETSSAQALQIIDKNGARLDHKLSTSFLTYA